MLGHAMKHARAFRSRKMCVDMYEKQIGMCECKICMRATCGGASWLVSGQAPVRQKRSMCVLRTCMSRMNLIRMTFKNTCDCVCPLYRTAHVAWARLREGGGRTFKHALWPSENSSMRTMVPACLGLPNAMGLTYLQLITDLAI